MACNAQMWPFGGVITFTIQNKPWFFTIGCDSQIGKNKLSSFNNREVSNSDIHGLLLNIDSLNWRQTSPEWVMPGTCEQFAEDGDYHVCLTSRNDEIDTNQARKEFIDFVING